MANIALTMFSVISNMTNNSRAYETRSACDQKFFYHDFFK